MSSRSFDDYAATESGLPLEDVPTNYIHGGRKPVSYIIESAIVSRSPEKVPIGACS